MRVDFEVSGAKRFFLLIFRRLYGHCCIGAGICPSEEVSWGGKCRLVMILVLGISSLVAVVVLDDNSKMGCVPYG